MFLIFVVSNSNNTKNNKMKLFEILKQQGLFSNDIKLRIKNNQISMNGNLVNSDIDLDVCLESDILDKFININLSNTMISNANNILFDLINDVKKLKDILSKNNLKKDDLDNITFNEAKDLLNTATIFESGRFIADTIKLNPIFAIQMKVFGFENLFESNIDNELTRILNQYIFIKISKKDSFLLKRK